MKSIKYGLFSYKTENIGDEVQSLAAERFLPRVDYYFDRDDMDSTKVDDSAKEVRVIMNGWFTHKPENWPPKNPKIKPLLISMHVERDALEGQAAKSFISEESREFLSKNGPVGARNIPTFDYLKKNGIDSYFSGCVTLTLIPDKQIKKQDYVLAVDVSDRVYEAMKQRTKRIIVRLDTYRSPFFSDEEKFLMAKYLLALYQSAHSVVTTRLHTMLPCLALGTPVFAISGRDPKRYSGLIDLVRHATEKDFLSNQIIFNIDKPGDNPKDYLKIRKSLEEKCSNFTGFDSGNSYLGNNDISGVFCENPLFLQLICDGFYASLERDLARGDVKFLKELCADHEKRIKQLLRELEQKETEKRLNSENYEKQIELLKNPGIKTSADNLRKAVVRRIKR